MRHPAHLLAALALAAAPLSMAHADGLALKRVMLSSGGVAYVEYAAEVDGAATLGLDVPLDQVDDLLTSLVVFDSAGGIGGIELPGRDGTASAFGDVPFKPEALNSPLDFLNSLQGVALEITGPRPMTGRLLRAERITVPAAPGQPAPPTPRTRVTLLSTEGLRQFILEDAETVQVADPALRARIAHAIEALRRDANHSARHITLRVSGDGKRTVRVGYVAAAALWKTSYRLILPPITPETGKARLQGWAVLENTTGAAWNGIQLALQYGNPVSFHQAIYRSYFVTRPEVPVEILGHLLPDVDTRATRHAEADAAPPPAPAPAMAPTRSAAKAYSAGRLAAIAPPAEQVASTEGAVDTVFALPHPVILAAGHTASLPIIDREVTARRVGLVQQGRSHPLAAVELTNDTQTSLPAGVLTLYDSGAEASFVGDARLGGLPAGESRLLAFAGDLRTTTTWRTDQATTIATLTAAAGVVNLQQRQRWTAHIDLTAPAKEARDLLIEIPRHPGGTLVPVPGLEPVTETATAWRLPVRLAAGEQRSLTVHVDRIQYQRMALTTDDRQIVRLLGMQGLDEPARTALQHLAALRTAEAARIAERDLLKTQRAEAERNEDRIRKNLAAVPANNAMHARILRQLEAEETRINALADRITQATAAADAAHQALGKAIAELKI